MGALNAKGHGLRVDAFDGGALAKDLLVQVAVAVESITQARADTGGHQGGTAAAFPVGVMNGAGALDRQGELEWADIFAALMFDDTGGAVGVGKLERHG